MTETSTGRWLVASLVLNLFLAGGIAGGAWRWWSLSHAPVASTAATAQPRGLRYAADDMTAEQRRAFRLGLRDARRDVGAPLQAARDSRQELLRLLNAPQFDRAAMLAALARTREADSAVRTRVESSVVDFASTLSPEDRQKFAAGLAKRSTMGPTAPASAPAATRAPAKP